MFNMNFMKDLVLCEIIERHKKIKPLWLLKMFIVGLSYRMTVLTVMVCTKECEMLILITFLHLNSDC